jgi:hypothetical protein
MIIAWALIFVAGIVLTVKLPVAAHIALLPLAFFAIGTVIDLLRPKSPAPLLIASVLGFAAAAFISFYHFFMLDVVMNFEQSHVKVAAFGIMMVVAMPMLLAFVRRKDLTWRPAAALLAIILALCVVQLFLPGFTPDRPRDMTLMYSEVEGDSQGNLVIESLYRTPDTEYARAQGFEFTEIDNGRLDTVSRPARPVAALGLPGLSLSDQQVEQTERGVRRRFLLNIPADSEGVRLTLPESAGLSMAWVDGELALDTSIPTKQQRPRHALSLVNPGPGPMTIELLTESDQPLPLAAVTRFELPAGLVEPFMTDWPKDAQPFLYGPRAEKIQEFTLNGVP